MERTDREPVSTFYAPGDWSDCVTLDEAAAHHASVKRLVVGDRVRLSSGAGRRAEGAIAELGKKRLVVERDAKSIEEVPRAQVVALWAPVGDRERMLMLAEKCVELGLSAWSPIIYQRSRSVNPRGDGAAFREKVRLRMVNALEQCGSAWLPELADECSLGAALAKAGRVGTRLLLDAEGAPPREWAATLGGPVTIALGPEGGLESAERNAFLADGWLLGSLGDNVLRFETAGIAALAIVRSNLV